MLSVAVIAKNASSTLPECLHSLNGLADQIVVIVDSSTTDNTESIAKEVTPDVIVRKFNNFSDQKNFALSKCIHEWILSVDADEIVSPELKAEIIQVISSNPNQNGFTIPRHNYIFGRLIRHTNWDPFGLLRLFKKSSSRWLGVIHEQVIVEGSIGKLKFPLIHKNYSTVEEFISRMNLYTTAEAHDKFSHQVPFSIFKLFTQPMYEFCRRFFWHLGFLDGLHGFFLSILMCIYHLSVHIKLWQKYHAS